ncbi:MAG: hemolysin family protein [Marinifilaceae bacterium]
MAEEYLIVSIVSMLVASAFFSGMEIAFISSNKLRIELDKKNQSFVSRLVSIFTKNPSLYICTMLVGNNIALVIYGIAMTKYIEPLFKPYITSDGILLLINTLISTFVILFTAEFLPKILFKQRPNLVLNLFSMPVFFFYIIFYPITVFTLWLSKIFISIFFGKDLSNIDNSHVFGKIDLNNLVQEHSIGDKTEEDDNEIRLFINALDFSEVKLRECMVPRTELVAIGFSCSISELRDLFAETGFSRILIYKDGIDNIIGYVHSSLLFHKPKNIDDCISKLIIVPETMQAQKLMKLFTKEHKSIALVVDEFGGTSGIVTIEDIMEEIFGEIEDEHDKMTYIEKQLNNTDFQFSGRLEIDYLNKKYGINLPESEEYETLAGLILYKYQNIPIENQEISIDRYTIIIDKVSDAKIEVVTVLGK